MISTFDSDGDRTSDDDLHMVCDDDSGVHDNAGCGGNGVDGDNDTAVWDLHILLASAIAYALSESDMQRHNARSAALDMLVYVVLFVCVFVLLFASPP